MRILFEIYKERLTKIYRGGYNILEESMGREWITVGRRAKLPTRIKCFLKKLRFVLLVLLGIAAVCLAVIYGLSRIQLVS